MTKRLLVIGWDAADWKVARPLVAAGEMPNLARLMSQGAHGNIATIYPALSPMLWTSIATGKRPHKHGIHGFHEPTEDGMAVRPISNLSRKSKTFWNILNQQGKRSIVAGWWPSHPAEPIRGAMVSDHFPLKLAQKQGPPMLPATISPAALMEELADLRIHPLEVTGDILRMFVPRIDEIDQAADTSLQDLAAIVAETMSIHAAFTDLMEREEWDLGAVYYAGIDHFSHRFMRYHAGKAPKKSDGTDPGIYADIIKNAYRFHDLMLGRLLHLAGDDCAVILLSDHGFHSDRLLPDYIPSEAAGPAVEHRHFGLICMRAPGVPAGSEIYGASILDITPTLLHTFGLPAGHDMDGKVLINAFPGETEKPRIATWEEVAGEDGRHPVSTQYDSASAAESLQQLVDLGYIAPLGPDTAKNVAAAVTENRYNLARACLDAGRTDLAANVLRDLIEQDPEQGRYHRHLIYCLLQEGNIPDGRKALDAFDAACADFAPRASQELKRRLAEKPDAELELTGKEKPSAKAQFKVRQEDRLRRELAEKSTGFTVERLMLRTRLALAQPRSSEKRKAARELLEQLAASKRPGDAFTLFLAEGFAALGEHTRALEFLRRARRSNPEDHHAIALSARVHLDAKNFEEAVTDATDALALVYHQPGMHYVLGQALARLGDPVRAEQYLRVAVAQFPGLIAAHRALGRLLRRDAKRLGEAALHTARANVLRDSAKLNSSKQGRAKILEEAPAKPMEQATLAFGSANIAPPADRSKVITIVSGLPRSGTSMMMQMLAAGGLAPHTDSEREADEDNPRGYFEHKQATELHRDSSWIGDARGKAVKIVAHLLPHLPPPDDADVEYRVVFMHRDLDEVIASQRAMLTRLGRKGARLEAARLSRAYAGQLVRVEEWLRRASGVTVMGLRYSDVVADPSDTASRVAGFLGEPFHAAQAAAAVDPALWRQRRA